MILLTHVWFNFTLTLHQHWDGWLGEPTWRPPRVLMLSQRQRYARDKGRGTPCGELDITGTPSLGQKGGREKNIIKADMSLLPCNANQPQCSPA